MFFRFYFNTLHAFNNQADDQMAARAYFKPPPPQRN